MEYGDIVDLMSIAFPQVKPISSDGRVWAFMFTSTHASTSDYTFAHKLLFGKPRVARREKRRARKRKLGKRWN